MDGRESGGAATGDESQGQAKETEHSHVVDEDSVGDEAVAVAFQNAFILFVTMRECGCYGLCTITITMTTTMMKDPQ